MDDQSGLAVVTVHARAEVDAPVRLPASCACVSAGTFDVLDPPNDVRTRVTDALTVELRTHDGTTLRRSVATWDEGRLRLPRAVGRAMGSSVDRTRVGAPMSSGAGAQGRLRDYQETIVDHLASTFEAGAGELVLRADCGLGKTIMAIALACRMGRRTAVLVHKGDLARQWVERVRQFATAGTTVGLVQREVAEWDRDIVVCMVQSLVARGSKYPAQTFSSPGLLVVDECHHCPARTFGACVGMFAARWRLGVTATPVRRDGLPVAWFLGPIAVTARRRMVGTAVPTVHWVLHTPGRRLVARRTRRGAVDVVGLTTQLVGDARRTDTIVRLVAGALGPTRRVLVVSARRSHLQDIRTGLLAAGVDDASICMYVGTRTKRDTQARDAGKGRRFVLSTYAMSNEALDIPMLSVLVVASPLSDPVQVVGRVLRQVPGKPDPRVFHLVDDATPVFRGMRLKCGRAYREQAYVVGRDMDMRR